MLRGHQKKYKWDLQNILILLVKYHGKNLYAIIIKFFDEQIIVDIMNEKEELSDIEQEENEITQQPTAKQAAEWLSGLRYFFEGNNNFEMISSIDKMETCIFQNPILKQKKISDYFHS